MDGSVKTFYNSNSVIPVASLTINNDCDFTDGIMVPVYPNTTEADFPAIKRGFLALRVKATEAKVLAHGVHSPEDEYDEITLYPGDKPWVFFFDRLKFDDTEGLSIITDLRDNLVVYPY